MSPDAVLLSVLATFGCLQHAAAQQGRQTDDTLRVALCSSISVGYKNEHAIAASQPMFDILHEQLDCQIHASVVKGNTTAELLDLGRKVDRGEYHLAVVWGLEYGWLREQHSQLRPLVVASQGVAAQWRATWPTQVMVRAEFAGPRVDDLRGKTIAVYQRSPMMNELFLRKLLKDAGEDRNRFFGATREFETPQEAVGAVKNGVADCIVVDPITFGHHVRNQPGRELVAIIVSHPFPEPVLTGRRDVVNRVQDHLWERLRRELVEIHHTERGRQSCVFWKMTAFVEPDPVFEQCVSDRVGDYPLLTAEINAGQDGLRRP